MPAAIFAGMAVDQDAARLGMCNGSTAAAFSAAIHCNAPQYKSARVAAALFLTKYGIRHSAGMLAVRPYSVVISAELGLGARSNSFRPTQVDNGANAVVRAAPADRQRLNAPAANHFVQWLARVTSAVRRRKRIRLNRFLLWQLGQLSSVFRIHFG